MIELEKAKELVQDSVLKKHLCVVIGTCFVDYFGRATSKLARGKRMVLIKGDNSISIHQNRLVRPINYMVNTRIGAEVVDGVLVLNARRAKPVETLKVHFYSVDDVHSYELQDDADLRLSGSERHLSDMLMQDLSFIEEGLKPCNKEEAFRKGVADIIAEDKNGKLVVIEVKRRQADYASVTQLERYMKQVRQMKGKETRGMLVAPSIRKNALELLERSGLEFAKIDFELLPNEAEKAHIKGLEKKQSTIDRFFQQ